jgi:tetratricopeptide (TPR) repeat protein
MRAFALLAILIAAPCYAAENTTNAFVLGLTNESLAAGSRALEQGRAEDGIRLTLDGLKSSTDFHDVAAGHANLCAGYAMLKRWEEALFECNLSIEIDDNNWRAYNNRSAVFTATGFYDRAIADVLTGLKLAPESAVLKKTLEIVYEHKRIHKDRSRNATSA